MDKLHTEVRYTDVLVIGAGAAASRAALESAMAGARTTMVTKGFYGKAGTSCYRVAETAGFSASGYADPEDSPEQHKWDILDAALGPCSPKLAEIVAEKAPEQVPFLESLGLVYQRYQGNYLATKGCFASRRRSMKIKGHGEPIVAVLRREILRQGKVEIVEHTMALDLITENGKCEGAYLLNKNGLVTEMRAGAVILGTGGAGQLFSQSLNPVDITGDGYALACRAGASLVNMEFMQAGFGVVSPAKTIFNAWIWALNPTIFDEDGRHFVQDYIPEGSTLAESVRDHQSHYPFSSRDASKYLEIAVKSKCNEGKRVFADLRSVQIPKDNINLDQMWPLTKAWMKHCGIDTDQDILQLVCYAHAINGGVLIDQNGQSDIPRLYAVGETAGGAHGADRLGGNMFSSGQVFGQIAGRHAAQSALQESTAASSAVKREGDIPVLSAASGQEKMLEIRTELRTLATDHLLIIRNESGLQEFLTYVEKAQHQLDALPCASVRELAYLYETRNLLLTGQMMAKAAQLRQESRGSHYRSDFPQVGGDQWRQAILQRLENGRLHLERVPLK